MLHIISTIFFCITTNTTETPSLSLHDALPISRHGNTKTDKTERKRRRREPVWGPKEHRSEEHTSELQSRGHLVCRLLLEKKKVQDYQDVKGKPEQNV